MTTDFKLTYATMFNPPEEMHVRYEAALAQVTANLGQACAMVINNKDHFSEETFENRSPVNTDWGAGAFPAGHRPGR